MKKLLALLLGVVLALSLSAPALADDTAPDREIYVVADGTQDDFDGDEAEESVAFTAETDEYGDGTFALTVAGQTVSEEYCVALDPTLRALKLGYGDYIYATLFMVSEYGPSDDPYTYCYLFTDGVLENVGNIPALAKEFAVDENGMISTTVRTDMLGTWFRPADFVLARGFDWESEDSRATYRLVEVPHDLYPMNFIVDLRDDLPVLASRFDSEPADTISGGQKLALTATDDVRWVHVTTLDGSHKGWIRVDAANYPCLVEIGGSWREADALFGNLLYAD